MCRQPVEKLGCVPLRMCVSVHAHVCIHVHAHMRVHSKSLIYIAAVVTLLDSKAAFIEDSLCLLASVFGIFLWLLHSLGKKLNIFYSLRFNFLSVLLYSRVCTVRHME